MLKLISILFLICFSSICALAQIQQSSTNFTILSKPKPSYTDAARTKGVEGKVVLKVTFLASGEIGDVVYIKESSKKKKLTKYGLVEKAMEAAKNIKFTPQMENGNPVTVSKNVEYNFDIY